MDIIAFVVVIISFLLMASFMPVIFISTSETTKNHCPHAAHPLAEALWSSLMVVLSADLVRRILRASRNIVGPTATLLFCVPLLPFVIWVVSCLSGYLYCFGYNWYYFFMYLILQEDSPLQTIHIYLGLGLSILVVTLWTFDAISEPVFISKTEKKVALDGTVVRKNEDYVERGWLARFLSGTPKIKSVRTDKPVHEVPASEEKPKRFSKTPLSADQVSMVRSRLRPGLGYVRPENLGYSFVYRADDFEGTMDWLDEILCTANVQPEALHGIMPRIRQMPDCVVRVVHNDKELGNAFRVGDKGITAYHVLAVAGVSEDGSSTGASLRSGQTLAPIKDLHYFGRQMFSGTRGEVVVFRWPQELDKVKSASISPANIAGSIIVTQARSTTSGNPDDRTFAASRCSMDSQKLYAYWHDTLRGDSGSPCHDQNGAVVGVHVSGGHVGGRAIAFSELPELIEFCKRNFGELSKLSPESFLGRFLFGTAPEPLTQDLGSNDKTRVDQPPLTELDILLAAAPVVVQEVNKHPHNPGNKIAQPYNGPEPVAQPVAKPVPKPVAPQQSEAMWEDAPVIVPAAKPAPAKPVAKPLPPAPKLVVQESVVDTSKALMEAISRLPDAFSGVAKNLSSKLDSLTHTVATANKHQAVLLQDLPKTLAANLQSQNAMLAELVTDASRAALESHQQIAESLSELGSVDRAAQIKTCFDCQAPFEGDIRDHRLGCNEFIKRAATQMGGPRPKNSQSGSQGNRRNKAANRRISPQPSVTPSKPAAALVSPPVAPSPK